MVGHGSFLPVKESFEVAKRALPSLARVGVAWNPAESNSEAFTLKAREACRELGLTLLEANVDSSAAVTEAVQSLVARGAQALWVGGDNTMLSTLGSAIATARSARIPVFTITPGAPDRGTLFDIGLDFHELGRTSGLLAGRVLQGLDPATVPIRDVQDEVPRRMVVNTLALAGLRDPWHLPDAVRADATVLVDATGTHERAARPGALARTWRVDLIQYNQVQDVEEAEAGVIAGFRESGLVEGRDYRHHRAQRPGRHGHGEHAHRCSARRARRPARDLFDADAPGRAPARASRCRSSSRTCRARTLPAPARPTPIICPTSPASTWRRPTTT